MKSDKDFIAGIYAKAKVYQEEQAKREDSNVIHISSFQRKIKLVSKYTAGVAACFACGIAVYLGTGSNQGGDNGYSTLEERKVRSEESTQPMITKSNSGNEGTPCRQDSVSQQIQCTIMSIIEQDGIDHIDAVVSSGEHVTLLVSAEDKNRLIEVGNELVLSVDQSDVIGNYSIKVDEKVYVYSDLENGEKIYTSDDQEVLRESDLDDAK